MSTTTDRVPAGTGYVLSPELAALDAVVSAEAGLVESVGRVSAEGSAFAVFGAVLGGIGKVHANIDRSASRASAVEISGTGGDVEPDLARAISIVEAIERHANCVPSRQVRWSSLDDLDGPALDMSQVPVCSPEELADPRCPVTTFDPAETVRWVQGWSLTASEPTWVPAVMTWLHMPPLTRSERFTLPISTGCAAHTDLAAAVVGGLCEVVERDAISLVWLQKLALPPIDFTGAPPEVLERLEAAERDGRRYRFFDATTDLGIPTVYCLEIDERHDTLRQIVMCDCNLDPALSVMKILREVAASRLGLETFGEIPDDVSSFITVYDGAIYMGAPERSSSFDFLVDSATPPVRLVDMGVTGLRTPHDKLDFLVERLASRGCDVVAVDISTRESEMAGVHVVKVVVPQLVPLSFVHSARFLGSPRVVSAPAAMGHPGRSLETVTDDPQPFA